MRSVVFFTLALALAALAAVVVRKRPADPVTRSFAAFSLTLAGWVTGIGGLYTGDGETVWGPLAFASASVIPAAFLSFAWSYPRPGRWPPRPFRQAVWAVALAWAVLSVTTRLVLADPGRVTPLGLTREPGPLYPLFAGYFLTAALVGLAVFLAKWRRARGADRVQLQYVGAGILIATGGCITANLLLPLATGHSGTSGVGPFFLLPFLVLVAHGIIRHRLLDLRQVLHRGVAFAAVITTVCVAAWELLWLAGAVPAERVSVPVASVLLILVAAICCSAPVAPRLARMIDRYLFRGRLDVDRVLQEATRSLGRPLTVEQLTRALVDLLEPALVPEWLLILVRPSGQGPQRVVTGGGFEPPAASGGDPFHAAAWAVASPVPGVKVLAGGQRAGDLGGAPDDVLRSAGVEVWIGLGRDLRRHGVILLGPRASGQPYFAPSVRFLEDLAELASMALDVAAYVTEQERSEAMLSTELQVLEMIATGAPLPSVLDALCGGIERQFDGTLCAVMFLDPAGARLRQGIAPSLPAGFLEAVDGLAVGPQGACCGTAAYLGKPVIVSDIASDPLWEGYRELALAHGLRACWSTPVFAADGATVGTFAMYFREPRSPDDAERRALERATHILGIAIGRVRSEEALRHTEDQLRHAQRIEALGQLAGGVAHDFNNLLTVITGRAEILQKKVDPAGTIRRDIDLIHKTAARGAALTQQLLAFSRKQVLQPKILDPAAVVTGMAPMLHRVIGEHIDLRLTLGATVGHVKADPAQLEQVVLNLVVNARDAMPDGGVLRLSVDRVELGPAVVRRSPGAHDGPHVRLTVADTGCGMTAETRAHLFEPFFTTKERGRGTGLGLSTVYGIVRQHGGHIEVESEPGHGSAFTIYLPAVHGVSPESGAAPAPPRRPGGAATILLVEDDDDVRSLARDVLASAGYDVLDAGSGVEALRRAGEHPGRIRLLVTDVVMPEMGGPELFRRLGATRPDLRVLYMSGYTGDALTTHGRLDPTATLLQKPFATDVLVQRVQESLEAPSPE